MERKLTGRPASPGLFAGPAAVLCAVHGPVRSKGSPSDEQAALRTAVAASLAEVSSLAKSADGEEAQRIMGLLISRYPAQGETPGELPPASALAIFKVAPVVISVLDYTKGFGHAELTAC